MKKPKLWPWLALVLASLAAAVITCVSCRTARFIGMGESRDLRDEKQDGLEDTKRTDLLIISLDGIGRDVLYELLAAKRLPGLASLLGGQRADGSFPHAYLAPDVLSVFPSTTLPAWASVFTGEPPAEHGVTGNEYFVREERRFAAPAPVSFSDTGPVTMIYTDGYANELLERASIYERMRAGEEGVLIWVSMSQFYAGADKVLLANETVFGEAIGQFLGDFLGVTDIKKVYQNLDEEVLEVIAKKMDEAEESPQVLTVYLPGIDLFTHQSGRDPDTVRTEYLVDVLDAYFADMHRYGSERGALADRYVVLTTDHGHSAVEPEGHLLVDGKKGDARAVLDAAGFRVRPFQLEVDDDDDFQAVLAYGGATAYVYLADRTTCPRKKSRCDFTRPPRYGEDVLAAAEAFHRANRTGANGERMRGTLDLILVRRPRPYPEVDEPFEVYVGRGQTVPLAAWLEKNPRPTYVRFPERLEALAVGPHGERAGDILLLTNFGNVEHAAERSYFAGPYRSWHGSPSSTDSEVAFIVAHPQRSASALRTLARSVLGEHPTLVEVGRLLVRLRVGRAAGGDWKAMLPAEPEEAPP